MFLFKIYAAAKLDLPCPPNPVIKRTLKRSLFIISNSFFLPTHLNISGGLSQLSHWLLVERRLLLVSFWGIAVTLATGSKLLISDLSSLTMLKKAESILGNSTTNLASLGTPCNEENSEDSKSQGRRKTGISNISPLECLSKVFLISTSLM